MDRRNFIRNTGLLAGSLVAGKVLAAVPADSVIRMGIIGCGDRGTGILHVLNTLPDKFEAISFSDILDTRMNNILRVNKGKGKINKDYRSVLDDKNVDAVVIATPLYNHYQIAADALKAGKHVYLEKTMTYNADQAEKLVKLAGQHHKQILQIGHQYRYSPLYYKVKDMISKNYLGKVTQVECRWDRNGSWRRQVPDPSLERTINWRLYKEYSGGLAAELLSHQIDFIDWAFNTHADTVTASGGIDFYKDGRETFDNIQAILRYEAGMIGSFGATCASSRDGYLFRIKGNKGTLSLLTNKAVFYPEPAFARELETVDGVTGATKLTMNKDQGIPIDAGDLKDGTWYALTGFYNCIQTLKLPDSNVYTGARTAFTVDMINQASLGSEKVQHWLPKYDSYTIAPNKG